MYAHCACTVRLTLNIISVWFEKNCKLQHLRDQCIECMLCHIMYLHYTACSTYNTYICAIYLFLYMYAIFLLVILSCACALVSNTQTNQYIYIKNKYTYYIIITKMLVGTKLVYWPKEAWVDSAKTRNYID